MLREPVLAYRLLKAVHVSAVTASLALFALRGAWTWSSPSQLRRRWVRIVPHVVDTALLASGIALAALLGVFSGNFLGAHAWLEAKVAGLVVYVVLGSIALKYGRSARTRLLAFIAALITFAWIVSVAISKSPAGFLGLI